MRRRALLHTARMSNLYAAPQAPLEAPDPQAPDIGWPGFGPLRRIAIIVNVIALVSAVLGMVIQMALLSRTDANLYLVLLCCLLLCACAALAGVLGLWRWRHVAAMRGAMLALNLLWVVVMGGLGLFMLALFISNVYFVVAMLFVTVFATAPAATTLAAYAQARRGRRTPATP